MNMLMRIFPLLKLAERYASESCFRNVAKDRCCPYRFNAGQIKESNWQIFWLQPSIIYTRKIISLTWAWAGVEEKGRFDM